MSRYIIVGAGAVGAALAAGLSQSGQSVVLISRGHTLDVIRARGLRFSHNGKTRALMVAVLSRPEDLELHDSDVLLFAMKTQDVEAAMKEWAWQPVRRSDGSTVDASTALPIVMLQNGLDAERTAARWFETVLSATVMIAASHTTAGVVTVINSPLIGQIAIGGWPSATKAPRAGIAARRVAHDLSKAHWLVQPVDEPLRWKAWKLLMSVTFGVEALAGSSAAQESLSRRLSDEARLVLTGAGFTFADPEAELTFDPADAAISEAEGDQHATSPLQSLMRGSGVEIDYLNGEIVSLARAAGAAAPINAALQRVLGSAVLRGEAPFARSVDDVLAVAEGLGRPLDVRSRHVGVASGDA